MKNWIPVGFIAILTAVLGYGQATGPQRTTSSGAPKSPASKAAAERALLDQYCVTCHNDKAKIANLSLENIDLATAGDHPELWEKVVRKLRAGLMPPPGI